jgi:hypothetical protein
VGEALAQRVEAVGAALVRREKAAAQTLARRVVGDGGAGCALWTTCCGTCAF